MQVLPVTEADASPIPEKRPPFPISHFEGVALTGRLFQQRQVLPGKILDLTVMPPSPSIFDRDSRATRSGILFLNEFVDDLKQPVMKDGKEHVEYVPTQVVTEYFRHAFDANGDFVRGILYPSSLNDGVCCVLFFEADQCGGEPNGVRLKPRAQWLRLDSNSIEHFDAVIAAEIKTRGPTSAEVR
jgi:hypothetical protein